MAAGPARVWSHYCPIGKNATDLIVLLPPFPPPTNLCQSFAYYEDDYGDTYEVNREYGAAVVLLVFVAPLLVLSHQIVKEKEHRLRIGLAVIGVCARVPCVRVYLRPGLGCPCLVQPSRCHRFLR